jgi:hypothetical protein
MIRCTCGNVLVSVEAICEVCLPSGLPRYPPVAKFAASMECLRCDFPIPHPRPGTSSVPCPSCGVLYGLDFFRV